MTKALSRKNLWDNAPRWAKAGIGGLFGLVPLQLLLGKRFRHVYRFVQEAQWWPAQRAVQYQLTHLRRICRLAYDKTVYYRREFDNASFRPEDLKDLDSLRQLPTITKQTVVDNLDAMCAVPPSSANVDPGSTGGTGGRPLQFYVPTNRSATEYAYLAGSWKRAGYELGTPLATIRGRVVQPDRKGFRHQYDPLLRHHYYSSFHMSDHDMRRYLDHIASLRPCFLHVYPSTVAMLDQQGQPVTTPGRRGEIVGTGFINTVMPFIRYRTGDYATYVGDHCQACGRQHSLIRDIQGHRTQEVLIAADGSAIPWTAMNMHDDTFGHVHQFQFRQDAPGRAVLRIIPTKGFVDDDRRHILANLNEKVGGQLQLEIELTDAIHISPRGKAVYVDQQIKGAPAAGGMEA